MLMAGDRLISVNDVNLDGISHATAIDMLQNTPDDVILVVSQPKERLYRGKSGIMSEDILCISYFYTRLIPLFLYLLLTESSSGYVPYQAKPSPKSFNSTQIREQDVDTSSEEHAGTGSPSPPPQSAGPPSSASSPTHQNTSVSSQDSRTSNVVRASKPPANGVQQCLERATAGAPAASIPQLHRPEPNVGLEPTPPALPPKTRKAQKVSEAPKVSEHSDWGDSDMDEETYSSSQEKLKVKKVRPLCS